MWIIFGGLEAEMFLQHINNNSSIKTCVFFELRFTYGRFVLNVLRCWSCKTGYNFAQKKLL